jgi:hypothetical protein
VDLEIKSYFAEPNRFISDQKLKKGSVFFLANGQTKILPRSTTDIPFLLGDLKEEEF